MFKKREPEMGEIKMNSYERPSTEFAGTQKVNTILKGSKLTGDINITCDMELSGEVEGNITSEKNSNIIIKGSCRGNLRTKEGNVNIEGSLSDGDVISGGDVKITGKFNGGKIEAKGKIYVNGEFSGRMESSDIEIGPNASGKGELFYRESISISKGAKIDAQISQLQEEVRTAKKPAEMKVVNLEHPVKDIKVQANQKGQA
ncbi:MAG TPA: polymer-forming cytoskeletal protein [Nitrospirae bacterium]|nr:polymer-forming cytoskeletal [bacterium BMS3Abin10]GBE38549.1 polymer-forming cytoskeletal [bacterium BMS3Bbin08]HDH50145.1 polymer-forming cytoskeletal protein [Nitrospirota bacterium]HDK81892.1 polymer-forming cytoskeletal protein [Nitrospirota bacterium]HDO26308.1 polymer-forming cytoskeletal protein [Nitrospirota bacterium]